MIRQRLCVRQPCRQPYLVEYVDVVSALSLHSKPFPRDPDGQIGRGGPSGAHFSIRTSLFGLHRAAQIRDLERNISFTRRRRRRTERPLGPPDWGSVERWAGGETLQISIKRILPAHAISPTALAPTALEYSLFLCPGCRTDRVRKPRAAPHMYSPLAAGILRHPASRSASRTWQASRWLPIWLRCTPSST